MRSLPTKFPYLSFLFCVLFIGLSSTEAQQLINQRQMALLEKARRPADPWPRGDGHMIIAEPGSPVPQKGYHEPGGSFSPGAGSFGLSIWVVDKDKKLVATSDDIAMDKIRQEYVFTDNSKDNNLVPGVATTTPYYTCVWRYLEAGKWELTLKDDARDEYSLQLVSRGVGPAAGPLNSVIVEKTRLLLNHRWLLIPSGSPFMTTGDEEAGELLRTNPFKEAVFNGNGWAFGKLDVSDTAATILIKDTKPQFNSQLHYNKTIQEFALQLPDPRFEKSLQAQIANLMMGYVGRQTGPGEPINYPLAWERDGAYSLVAIAKSGHLQTAKELSAYFAENDFFGGFGAEGDAPGSAINALTEVAYLINEPDYYQWIWPHIKRKLTIIDEMMNAKADVYKNYVGPLAPHLEYDTRRRQLICRKTEDSLIVGTMDGHFPVLYINAISYRGLVQASRLANHFNDKTLAAQCLEKARILRSAWMRGFGKQKYDNERNFMISVWPSWITNKDYALFREKITAKHQEEWNEAAPKERPLWTYFTAAEAHQWLFLDQPDMTWKTLRYFWAHQSSPGLYTYWEGNGEENSFRQWENYRGWLQPKYVTPHYWTASEMTLLQLDMLVYIDESGDEFQLVIGAGIPAEWLKEAMSVKNYRTKAGTVSWEYKNNRLDVVITGAPKKYKVKPGINFANAKTIIKVTYK